MVPATDMVAMLGLLVGRTNSVHETKRDRGSEEVTECPVAYPLPDTQTMTGIDNMFVVLAKLFLSTS